MLCLLGGRDAIHFFVSFFFSVNHNDTSQSKAFVSSCKLKIVDSSLINMWLGGFTCLREIICWPSPFSVGNSCVIGERHLFYILEGVSSV